MVFLIDMNIILFSDADCADKNTQTFFFKHTDARYHHAKKILKLQCGSSFKAGFINEQKGIGTVLEFSEDEFRFHFTPAANRSDFLFPVELIVGFPRPIQLKRCLKDIATLGVSKFHLVPTELGEASYLQSDLASETEMQKFLIDGASQAGSTLLPQVKVYRSIKHFFTETRFTDTDLKIILDVTDTAQPIHPFLQKQKLNSGAKIFLAIGNERGWTADERTLFAENHFKACSMGSRILKTETAVTTSTAVVLSTLGFWEQ